MVLFGLVDYLAASQELNADFDVDVLLNGSVDRQAPFHRGGRSLRRRSFA